LNPKRRYPEILGVYGRVILKWIVRYTIKRLRWSRGSVLAFRTKVRGFNPGPEAVGFFKAKKKRSSARLPF
jgi:long-subunit fatty acid transport protein